MRWPCSSLHGVVARCRGVYVNRLLAMGLLVVVASVAGNPAGAQVPTPPSAEEKSQVAFDPVLFNSRIATVTQLYVSDSTGYALSRLASSREAGSGAAVETLRLYLTGGGRAARLDSIKSNLSDLGKDVRTIEKKGKHGTTVTKVVRVSDRDRANLVESARRKLIQFALDLRRLSEAVALESRLSSDVEGRAKMDSLVTLSRAQADTLEILAAELPAFAVPSGLLPARTRPRPCASGTSSRVST
jgi:hypothetical protein